MPSPGAGPPRDRADAQRRVQRIRAFRAELEALAAAGLAPLTGEQQDAIHAYHDELLQRLAAQHDVDRSEAAEQLSLGLRVASFFAALALTAAVYSLVARFWSGLDVPVQATLLCAFPLVALIGVELSARREQTRYVASIFALVAFGTYWLAVVVLSELLNVPLAPPALWGGALFGVALALPYGFRLVLASALVVFLVALAGSVFHAVGVPWTVVPEFPEVISAAAWLLVAAAAPLGSLHPAVAPIARGVGLAVAFLGLLLLSSAGPASLLPTPDWVSELIYQGVMLVACVGAIAIGVRRQLPETVYISAAALTLFLFGRFVDWFWDPLPRFVFFLLLAALAFAWIAALRRVRARLQREGHGA